jgi:3-dehydroquinate synthase
MVKKTFSFTYAAVEYYFEGSFSNLKTITEPKKTILITDENVITRHQTKFKGWNTVTIKSGEAFKVQATVDSVIGQLIEMGADRTYTLVGVGGGVVTDLAGYIASVYMRGINFGFVPTTLLAAVDASIGGKNGIDVGLYKNMVGCIRQPKFILHDVGFFNTLPDIQWKAGFAEIIKHAAIKDVAMFRQLEEHNLAVYQKKKPLLAQLIQRNAILKTKVVQGDEFEKGDRKLLNFGHTFGHAIENEYKLTHGEAVAIGMVFAAKLSTAFASFKYEDRVTGLIEKYGLPVSLQYNKDKVFSILKTDKKKESDYINYVLLKGIGKGIIHKLSLEQIYNYM